MLPRSTEFFSETIAVIGVGLIGGSVAAAARKRALARSVVGVGRNHGRLLAARDAGVIDEAVESIDDLSDAPFVVVCTPVDRIAQDVRRAAEAGPGTLITDAGSVKACICDDIGETLPSGASFVGAHPLAGSEKTGWENSREDLFEDRLCVLTPGVNSTSSEVQRVEDFWQALGMKTRRMTPEAHDRAVAATSHVPHVAAAAVMSLLTEDNSSLAATGFRDVTRIAAGDPQLWTAILEGNRSASIAELDRLIEVLSRFRLALEQGDFQFVRKWLDDARTRRNRIE